MGEIAPSSLSRGSGERPYPDISYAAVRLECFWRFSPRSNAATRRPSHGAITLYIASRLAAKHFSHTPQS
ncbi:MAG: hypothetical protein Q8K75_08420 [Chlamydiales bacterium]|nr:hypothetical protein [Chlamydiales bacterium]